MTSHIQQQMHDIEPDPALGKGCDHGAGDKFYVLGKRCETNEPDNDSTTKDDGDYKHFKNDFYEYDNFGKSLYNNSQTIHSKSFQETFGVLGMHKPTLGEKIGISHTENDNRNNKDITSLQMVSLAESA